MDTETRIKNLENTIDSLVGIISKMQELLSIHTKALSSINDAIGKILDINKPTEPEVGFAETLMLNKVMDLDPNCGCHKCNPRYFGMIVCDTCGNKRCPHATDHDNPCTNSNAPGQPGSRF